MIKMREIGGKHRPKSMLIVNGVVGQDTSLSFHTTRQVTPSMNPAILPASFLVLLPCSDGPYPAGLATTHSPGSMLYPQVAL